MSTFTVFCVDVDHVETVWIGAVEAEDAQAAAIEGRRQCAEAWQAEEITDVRVMGVAVGDVEIALWDDEGCCIND